MAKVRLRPAGVRAADIRRALQRADYHNVVQVLSDLEAGSLDVVSSFGTKDIFVVKPDGEDGLKAIYGLRLAQYSRWLVMAEEDYSSTPQSTSRIGVSDTAGLVVGEPLAYLIGGGWRYGLITAVGSNYVDVCGASLSGSIEELRIGRPEQVVVERWKVSGAYGDDVASLLETDENTFWSWRYGKAYLVSFRCRHTQDDTTENPYINVSVNDNNVSTANSGDGIQPSTSWVDNPAVAIDVSNYGVDRGADLEIECTMAGDTGDAQNLTVEVVFVLE